MGERTRFETVADDVYAVLGSDGMPNAVCIDGGDDGVVVVDSRFTPRFAEEMMDALREVSDGRVIALINTHFHPDHTLGNPGIPTDRILAHENAKAKLAELGDALIDAIRTNRPDLAPELEGATLRLPTETIREGLELQVGSITLEIRHPERTAHTDGDLYIRIPERDVLLVADLVFNGVVPVMRDGDIQGLRTTLQELQDDAPSVVVPGHGEVGGPELLGGQIDFIDTVMSTTEQVLSDGGDTEDAERAVLDKTRSLLLAEQRISESVSQAVAAIRS